MGMWITDGVWRFPPRPGSETPMRSFRPAQPRRTAVDSRTRVSGSSTRPGGTRSPWAQPGAADQTQDAFADTLLETTTPIRLVRSGSGSVVVGRRSPRGPRPRGTVCPVHAALRRTEPDSHLFPSEGSLVEATGSGPPNPGSTMGRTSIVIRKPARRASSTALHGRPPRPFFFFRHRYGRVFFSVGPGWPGPMVTAALWDLLDRFGENRY